MHPHYENYADAHLQGAFAEMSSWRFVRPYLLEKRVLDIGCSDGLYLGQLSADSQGIEQVPSLVEQARRRGLDIIQGDVMQTLERLPAGQFEGVLFSHVMEHLDCPVTALRQINRLLGEKGILVLGLPIERCIYRDLLRMDYFAGTHLYAFSLRNARKLLQETGFSVKTVFFHLPKCRGKLGGALETAWNSVSLPFRSYFSMAYWVVAEKRQSADVR